MVFFLILMTNLIDRNNFVQVKKSISTIYEDRLMANDLIIRMLQEVHQTELQLQATDTLTSNQYRKLLNEGFTQHVATYEATKLTKEEELIFDDFKSNLQKVGSYEENLQNQAVVNKEPVIKMISALKNNLYQLSEIQINEGRNQMLISRQAVDTVELFTQIEIYILIALAILVQIIVMQRTK